MRCSPSNIMVLALVVCTTSLAAQPQSDTDFVAAVNALNAAQYEEALRKLQGVVQAQPDNEAAWYYLGVANYHLQHFPEALAALTEAEKLMPKRPGVRLYIGHIYAAQGALEEAIIAYEKELAKLQGPQRTEALVALGKTRAQAGQLKQAREALARAVYYDPGNVEAFFYLGHANLRSGDPQTALDNFTTAKETLQEWNDLRIRLGRVKRAEARRQQITEEKMAQQYSGAEYFAQELGLWPDLKKALGDTYLAMEKWTEARNAYRDALRRDELGNPSDPDVYTRISRAYLADAQQLFDEEGLLFSAIGVIKSAIEAANQALEFDANYAPAHEVLGEIYAMQARTYASDPERDIVSHTYEEALDEFSKGLIEEPDYIRALTNMARTYLDQIEQLPPGSSEALTAQHEVNKLVQAGLRVDPNNAELYAEMARLELAQEKWPAALETAQHALSLDPKNTTALNTAGLARYYQYNPRGAIRYFTEAIQIDPQYSQSYTNLGNAFFQMQSWYRARRQYKKALERIPEAVAAGTAYQRSYILHQIGLTYHETGDYDPEIEVLNQALALDPTYFEAYWQLGRAYLNQEQYRAARRALEIAVQNAPTDQQMALAYTQIGQVYEVEGDPHGAIAVYSSALEVDPYNPVARSAIARLSR